MAVESALKRGVERPSGPAVAGWVAAGVFALAWVAPASAFQACRTETVTIPLNRARPGNLSPDDLPLSRFVQDAGDSRADRYLVSVPRAGELRVALHSDEFEPLLLVLAPDCRELARFQRPRCATIQLKLSRGNYIIVAAAARQQFGQYRLETLFGAPPLPPVQIRGCEPSLPPPPPPPPQEVPVVKPVPCPEPPLAPGAQGTAILSARCPVSRFQLPVTRRGTLAVASDPPNPDLRFVLFDSTGNPVAKGPRIDSPLRPGSYRLAVHSASGAAGSFPFRTSLVVCPEEREIALGAPAKAELSPQCPANDFHFAVARRGQLKVGPVEPLHFVLSDSAGNRIAQGPRIDHEVRPATYRLAVSSVSGAARSYDFQADLTCPLFALRHETTTEYKEETLAASDFRLGDCGWKEIPSGFASGLVHQYQLPVKERSNVLIDLVSSAFVPYLFLLDPTGRRIAQGEGKGANAHIDRRGLLPGNHTILAVSPSGATGTYGLRSILKPAPCFLEKNLPAGKPAERSVSASDCRLCEDYSRSADCASLVHEYRVELGQAAPLRIDLNAAFNADLIVLDEKGAELPAACKSGGGTRNVRIQCSAARGGYRVLAVALGGQTGVYTFQWQSQRECPPQDIALNANLEETITQNDCQLPDGVFADLYRVTTKTPAGFTVEIESSAFAPCVLLLDSAGKRVEPACSPRIAHPLSPGVYSIIARPLSQGTGPYRLRTSDRTPPCALTETSVAAALSGRLFTDDCRMKDVLPNETGEAFVDRYSVQVQQRGKLSVAVSSNDFVPCVMLYDSRYNRLGQNCNSGRAAIAPEPVLETGRYYIMVTSLGVSAGDYTLQNSFTPQ